MKALLWQTTIRYRIWMNLPERSRLIGSWTFKQSKFKFLYLCNQPLDDIAWMINIGVMDNISQKKSYFHQRPFILNNCFGVTSLMSCNILSCFHVLGTIRFPSSPAGRKSHQCVDRVTTRCQFILVSFCTVHHRLSVYWRIPLAPIKQLLYTREYTI